MTLGLRSHGPAQHIALDAASGRVTDIRGKLGTGNEGEFLFTGIYAVEPAFFDLLTPGKIESVIPIFLSMIQKGLPLGGVLLDEGQWWDLGNRESYLDALRVLRDLNSHFPAYAAVSERERRAIAPTATVTGGATLRGCNIIGPQAAIEPGATLEDCILWPGARVLGGADLRRCIVRSGAVASGTHRGEDI